MAAAPSRGRASQIEGVAAPDADLTRVLYEQHGNQIFRYCLHQLGSREEAEDATQSTFLNAFRGIRRGVVPELESAWLFKIAHNVCLSRRRSTWRRGRIESPTDFELVEELAPAPSRRGDELIGLQDVLEQLPENQRRAILLREWQGLSYREIAAELELSQAAVETLIFRARRALATGLEQPPKRRRRVVRAADWGNAVAALKSFALGGGVAAKVAAAAVVVGATTVVAAAPVTQTAKHTPPPTISPAQPSSTSPVATQLALAAVSRTAARPTEAQRANAHAAARAHAAAPREGSPATARVKATQARGPMRSTHVASPPGAANARGAKAAAHQGASASKPGRNAAGVRGKPLTQPAPAPSRAAGKHTHAQGPHTQSPPAPPRGGNKG